MKNVIAIILVSFFAFSAFANDGSSPAIKVKGIDPQNSTDGTRFKVYGGNTDDLFEMIPAGRGVDPVGDKEYAESYREIYIHSAGWNISISCAKKDDNGVALVRGTECQFQLNKQAPEGFVFDTYDYKPYCSAVQ